MKRQHMADIDENVLAFPGKRQFTPTPETKADETELKHALSEDLLEELIKETHEILDQSIQSSKESRKEETQNLPLFVRRMNTMNSIKENIRLLESMGKELNYYLDEIDIYN